MKELNRYVKAIFGISLMLLISVSGVMAGDIHVDVQDGACVSGTGQADPYGVVYCALEDALIDAVAGDVIHIAAGLYQTSPPIPYTIDKSLTLLGPQAGVDPRPMAGTTRVPGSANEAILDGQGAIGDLVLISADNVTIDGLEITNASDDMILQPFGVNNAIIRYCIAHQTGDEAIQFYGGADGLIEYNHVYDTGMPGLGEETGDGISIVDYGDNHTISNNEIHAVNSEHGCIYCYRVSNINVIDNKLYDNSWGGGIRWGRNSSYTNNGGLIQGNEIYNVGEGGIDVEAFPTSGLPSDVLEIKYNNIHDITNASWSAIQIIENSMYVWIEGNNFSDNYAAIRLHNDGTGPPDATTITVINNNFYNNSHGIINETANGLLTAEYNYWGDPSGPEDLLGNVEVPPCDLNPLIELNADGLGDDVSDDVDYCPWLQSPWAPSTPTPVPTDTPVPTVTPIPTDTPIPPTETPVPTDTPIPPTNTPTPEGTSTPIPPIPTTGTAGIALLLMVTGAVLALGRKHRNR